MKKIYYLLLAIAIFTLNSNAQAPAIQWEKSLGGSSNEGGLCIQQTSDGGFIVGAQTNSNDGDVTGFHGGLGDDYWVVKLDALGNIQNKKCLGGSWDDFLTSIRQTSDGGYIVSGGSLSNNGNVTGHHGLPTDLSGGNTDCWIVRLDNSLNIQWQKSLGGAENDHGQDVQQTSDGGFIVLGETYSSDGDVTGNYGEADFWVVKLDQFGTIEWQKSLGGSLVDRPQSIQQTSDGGYIVAGFTESPNDGDVTGYYGNGDAWIVKLNSSGNIQLQKCLGGSSVEIANYIRQTIDGGYIMAGLSSGTPNGDVTSNNGGNDWWVVKLDAFINIEWQKSLGGSLHENAFGIEETIGGGYIVSGVSKSNDGNVTGNHGSWDYWIVKLNSVGFIQWQNSFGGSGDDISRSIKQTADGGYIITGESNSVDGDLTNWHGAYDCWVVKLQGCQPSIILNGNTLQSDQPLGNQWYMVGNSNPLGSLQTYTPTQDGNYYVIYSGNNNCVASSDTININTVGVSELDVSTQITIYPIPTTSEITVSGYSPAYLKLCDAVGQTVAESKSNKLYVGNLSQGLYVLQLFDANGQQVKTEKVIVAK